HLRTQRAHAAHDQVDAHPGLARLVQLLDEPAVQEPVHLRDDPGRPPPASVLALAANPLDEALAQVARGEQEMVELVGMRVPGEEVEELGQVLAERLAAREETEIL